MSTPYPEPSAFRKMRSAPVKHAGMVVLLLALLAMALAAFAATPVAGAKPEVSPPLPDRPPPGSNVIEGRYIVVFEDSAGRVGAEINQRERRVGFQARLRYRHALRGFAARLSRAQAKELRADPEVKLVNQDRRVEASAEMPLAPGDSAPTGVRRILAATETTAREHSGVGVAVIDTGIQLDHPDLNAKNGTNCIAPGSPPNDGDGHGTHVAGSVGATNEGSGVVGVAPDTEVHAVKVLDDDGFGTFASIICGVDWVTANHSSRDIGVANMSLGGFGPPVQPCGSTADALHEAICNSTAAGVNYVVAAGNSGWDFDFAPEPDVPAAYPEVLTVTAVSDSDGFPGGSTPSCDPWSSDDEVAWFSNFAATPAGQAHTIAAPGVCIESTWRGGGYETISGTSMASPHAAGIVALCMNEAGSEGPCAGLTPAEVISHLRDDAATFNDAHPIYGFLRDPLHFPLPGRYYGFLTRELSSGNPPPPPPPPAPPPNDDFANTEDLGGGSSVSASGTNVAATAEPGEPDHDGLPARASVWYGWTAPANGPVRIDTCGSNFDTVLAVYTGSALNALTRVASNDDACGLRSRVQFNASAGETYRIAIDGYLGAQGSIELELAPGPSPPPNDNFANSEDLGSGSTSGTNVDATAEPGEPAHAGIPAMASVWYRWTAPAHGAVEIETCGSDFDTVLAVYTGSALDALTPVASNDDTCGLQSQVQFNAAAGTTYRIAVDGYFGDQGSIELELGQSQTGAPPPPPPDEGASPPPPPPDADTPPPDADTTSSNDFTFGKVRRNKRRGTARLIVKVPGPGNVKLARNRQVRKAAAKSEAAGRVRLRVRPTRKAKRVLNERGRAKVRAKVTYTPKGGKPRTKVKRLRLIKRR
jgi:subtilisin